MRGRNTGKCWYRTKHTGNKAEQVVARPTNQPTDLRRFNNIFSRSFLFFSGFSSPCLGDDEQQQHPETAFLFRDSSSSRFMDIQRKKANRPD